MRTDLESILGENSQGRVQEMDINNLKAKMENEEFFFLIDVREDHEWQDGHIPNAVHIKKGLVERDIDKIVVDKSAPVILYCGSGYRSTLAAETMQKMGYTHVYSLQGGIKAWLSANYPLAS